MRKALSALSILIVLSMLFACGGGGGGGGKGSKTSGKSVRLGFDIVSSDGKVVYKNISANGTNPLPDALYYYKATPKWAPKSGTIIEGATDGFESFDPATFSRYFSLGNWEFEVEIRTNSVNNVVLYKTSSISPVNVNASTTTITVNVDKQMNGTGYVSIDIYAPTVGDNEKVLFYYGKINGAEEYIELIGEKITSGEYEGFTEFKYVDEKTGEDKLALPAGLYIFRAIYTYTYGNDTNSIDISNGNIAYCEVFGDGEVSVSGTIEGNENVEATFSLNGIYAMGVIVKAVRSETDHTEVAADDIAVGGKQVYMVIPRLGSVSGNDLITYVAPDTYQWYVNGEPVGEPVKADSSDTFTFTDSANPGTNYIYCLASKKNDDGIVEYAAGAGKVLVVKPDSN